MFDTLPGFREFPPDACAQRNHLFRVFRTVARAFDFQEYDVPTSKSRGKKLQISYFTLKTRGEEKSLSAQN